MKIIFSNIAWDDYTSWLKDDRRIIVKINDLIKDIKANPTEGKGKPEPLKYDLSGLWSRRIDREHRLVYKVEDEEIYIFACRYHYDK
ncbi:MAG TPA: Txe/YoeB family addiction module toxin [Clostridiales bacterium]|nr:Txe/YoeB family addiction module toxin [Clostridiales bacterium]HQP69131.1 Txe/YoeB family addiction module toxin [Clostridiales bacterium]